MTTRIAAASFAALLIAGSLAGATFAQTPAAPAAPAAMATTTTTAKTTLVAKDTTTATPTKVVKHHRVKKTKALVTKVKSVKGEAKIGGAVVTKVSATKVVAKTAVTAPTAQ